MLRDADARAKKCPYAKDIKWRHRSSRFPPASTEPYILQCVNCNYEHDGVIPPARCPRCSHDSFERLPRPGSLLNIAIHHE